MNNSNIKAVEYPLHLLEYMRRVAHDQSCAMYIMVDEFLFSSYFTAIMQGIRLQTTPEEFMGSLEKILKKNFPDIDLTDLLHDARNQSFERREKMMTIMNGLRGQFGDTITSTYMGDFFISMSIYEHLKNLRDYDLFGKFIDDTFDSVSHLAIPTVLSQNVEFLSDLISMDDAESALIELNLLFSIDNRCMIFRDFITNAVRNTAVLENFYAVMLAGNGVSRQQAVNALSSTSLPITLGIVNYDTKTKKLSHVSEFWVYTLSKYYAKGTDFYNVFVSEIKDYKKTFAGAIAKANPKDEELLMKFFDVVSIDSLSGVDSESLNVLVYGAKKLDKLSYVFELLKRMKLEGYTVNTREAKSKDIPGICYVAQQFIKIKGPSTILIVDKAEQALTRYRFRQEWMWDFMSDDQHEKASREDLSSDELLLVKNPVPTIWIVSSLQNISPENVGRILMHVELKGGSRADRKAEVEKVINELGYSPELSLHLSKYYELGVEQIKSAARITDILEFEGVEGEESMIHFIRNSQKALERERIEEIRESVTKYSLDLLNLAGNMPPDKIIQALKNKGKGTLCFYGAPGTGKTQLAEYMAIQLDKPILIKPASELLDKFLGESEKRIAEMFEQARDEEAILLLDEADSFLRDRSMARHSWEITQVNELLQRMERHHGIFICTTNLFSAIDAAALRRFTFKLEFRPLTYEQRIKMLENEVGFKVTEMSEVEREKLFIDVNMIQYLTPGDFATVKRQADLFGENLSLATWIERLEVESKAKMAGVQRNTYNNEREVDLI
jgi:DNA replication protein DnaC